MSENYRYGVGAFILNNKNEVFVGARIDNDSDYWQMPQGGIDENEDPINALFREIEEEIGVKKELLELIDFTPDWLFYDFPEELRKNIFNGKYAGQKQKWYLLKFTGQNSDINIQTEEPEFRDWKWSSTDNLISDIIPFKKGLYTQVYNIFNNHFK